MSSYHSNSLAFWWEGRNFSWLTSFWKSIAASRQAFEGGVERNSAVNKFPQLQRWGGFDPCFYLKIFHIFAWNPRKGAIGFFKRCLCVLLSLGLMLLSIICLYMLSNWPGKEDYHRETAVFKIHWSKEFLSLLNLVSASFNPVFIRGAQLYFLFPARVEIHSYSSFLPGPQRHSVSCLVSWKQTSVAPPDRLLSLA